jgi:hypothetical protein
LRNRRGRALEAEEDGRYEEVRYVPEVLIYAVSSLLLLVLFRQL